jgi:GT2 family glycosyltransferase
MNFCAERVQTEWIMFLHADFFVSKDWDINALKKTGDEPIWVSSYRVQPDIFYENSRPGTLIVMPEEFGEYHHNFDEPHFIEFAEQFATLNDIEVRKGEGVSGLIRKRDWDAVGGNDQLFAPAYYEDYDLFVRMQLAGYKFLLTSKSVVYHFGSRASRFPDDNLKQRKPELADHEKNGFRKWMQKWGQPPQFDENGFIKPIKGTNNPIKV